jgi:hypothetical protein
MVPIPSFHSRIPPKPIRFQFPQNVDLFLERSVGWLFADFMTLYNRLQTETMVDFESFNPDQVNVVSAERFSLITNLIQPSAIKAVQEVNLSEVPHLTFKDVGGLGKIKVSHVFLYSSPILWH